MWRPLLSHKNHMYFDDGYSHNRAIPAQQGIQHVQQGNESIQEHYYLDRQRASLGNNSTKKLPDQNNNIVTIILPTAIRRKKESVDGCFGLQIG